MKIYCTAPGVYYNFFFLNLWHVSKHVLQLFVLIGTYFYHLDLHVYHILSARNFCL